MSLGVLPCNWREVAKDEERSGGTAWLAQQWIPCTSFALLGKPDSGTPNSLWRGYRRRRRLLQTTVTESKSTRFLVELTLQPRRLLTRGGGVGLLITADG
jgi:hypothetical protein